MIRYIGRRGGRRGFAEAERRSITYDILRILWDAPRDGSGIMLAIEEQRGFRPSPRSINPALQTLEDGGFVIGRDIDGTRVYTIADAGSERLAEHRETPDAGSSIDDSNAVSPIARGVRTMVGVKRALKEISRPEIYARALAIVERARRDLFALLTHEERPPSVPSR